MLTILNSVKLISKSERLFCSLELFFFDCVQSGKMWNLRTKISYAANFPTLCHVTWHLQIKAELTVARQHGCDVIRDVVSRVVYPETADDTQPMTVHTDLGNTYQCRKVIVATGSFTTLRQLLPRGFTPDIRFVTQSVIYAELSDNDVTAMRLT